MNLHTYIKKWGIFNLFCILALCIYFTKTNANLFYFINSLHIYFNEKIFTFFNQLANSKLFILPISMLIITIIKNKKYFFRAIGIIIAYYVVFSLLKHFVHELRPYMVLDRSTFFLFPGHENLIEKFNLSFPSGHTGIMAIFAFYVMRIAHQNSKLFKLVLITMLFAVGLTRIMVGMHWPLDVINSGLIGYLIVQIFLYKKD